jgi:hypothetical protein
LTAPDRMGRSSGTLGSAKIQAWHRRFGAAIDWIALAVAVIASLSLLGWVLWNCRSGFDFTDEGFYLNWMSNPWNYRASVSQFGFVYHPLYEAVGEDIALLRQANVLMLFALAWLLCQTSLGSVRVQPAAIGPFARGGLAGIALVVASSILPFLQVWLPTPNYNSLTLQSMLLAATGAVLVRRGPSTHSAAGWNIIGVGCGLAFLAKPPSAVMLGVLLAIYLAAAGKLRFGGMLMAGATAGLLVVIAAFAIDGSLSDFVRRIVEGVNLSNRRLAAAHAMDRLFALDQVAFGRQQEAHFIRFLVVLLITMGLALLASRFQLLVSIFIAVLVAVVCIIAVAGLWSPKILRDLEPLHFLGIASGAILAALLTSRAACQVPARKNLATAGLFLALPWAFAFGTDNGYLAAAAHAGLFWLLAGLVFCLDRSQANAPWQTLLPAIGLSLVVTAGTLLGSIGAPYRQLEALNRQINVIDLPQGKSQLVVSKEAADYILTLRRVAAAGGFRPGDPMLDLTGESPGSLYAIGARPLAAPWTLGGYRGTTAFVAASLNAEPCDAIATSWILSDHGSTNTIPSEVLVGQGIDLSADYSVVGSIHGTRSEEPPSFEYRLLRPARSPQAAQSACEEARRR